MSITGAAGKTGVIFLIALPALLFVRKRETTVRYLFLVSLDLGNLDVVFTLDSPFRNHDLSST